MSYDLFSNAMGIAKSIVTNSKGMGFSTFDADVIKADVDRAAGIADVARAYQRNWTEKHNASEKVKAAKTLGLETEEYEREYNALKAEEANLIAQLEEIASGFQKDYWGDWTEK